MKATLLLSALLVLPAVAAPALDRTTPLPENGRTAIAAGEKTTAKRYPLRGVITAVQHDPAALMIKHEDIPGLMRAMTMLFRVDDAIARSAKVGQAITGFVTREGDSWWLHDAKLSDAPAK